MSPLLCKVASYCIHALLQIVTLLQLPIPFIVIITIVIIGSLQFFLSVRVAVCASITGIALGSQAPIINHEVFRLRCYNGDYIRVSSEWTFFLHPWMPLVESVRGNLTVIQVGDIHSYRFIIKIRHCRTTFE